VRVRDAVTDNLDARVAAAADVTTETPDLVSPAGAVAVVLSTVSDPSAPSMPAVTCVRDQFKQTFARGPRENEKALLDEAYQTVLAATRWEQEQDSTYVRQLLKLFANNDGTIVEVVGKEVPVAGDPTRKWDLHVLATPDGRDPFEAIVEVDGEQHSQEVSMWGTLDSVQAADVEKARSHIEHQEGWVPVLAIDCQPLGRVKLREQLAAALPYLLGEMCERRCDMLVVGRAKHAHRAVPDELAWTVEQMGDLVFKFGSMVDKGALVNA
jgi:hypothetical protein